MPRAPCYKKTSHSNCSSIKTPFLIKLFVFAPMSNISNILSAPPAFSIEAHSSPYLPSI